jgi:hypothetical protein
VYARTLSEWGRASGEALIFYVPTAMRIHMVPSASYAPHLYCVSLSYGIRTLTIFGVVSLPDLQILTPHVSDSNIYIFLKYPLC